MAWPKSNWISTDLPTYADFNNVALAFATWGGNVDAGAHTLSNLGNVALAAGSRLSMPGQPHIAVHNHATLSVPGTSVWTPIPWDTTDVTVGGITIASTTRLTAPVAGWYQVNYAVGFNPGIGGNYIYCGVSVNGADTGGRNSVIANSSIIQWVCASWACALAIGDYVEIRVYQASGSAVSTFADVTRATMTMLF